MTAARVELPEKLIPVFDGEADVRGAYGGRGSAKTRSFAKMSAVRAYMWAKAGREGVILCAREFMNSLDDSSLAEVKLAIQSEPWLAAHFDIGEKYVRTRDGRVRYVFSGLDRNISSIKSKSRILLCWVDEAEPVSGDAWQTLIPTLREEDSELWVTWNPARKGGASRKNADYRFRQTKDPRYKVVEMNWRDNPKFPEKLSRERLRDKENSPDQYEHIWEGGYVTVVEGAYFAKHLTKAREQHRIGKVAADPNLSLRVFCDLGGTGAKADAFAMWVGQFVGKEIRVLDYYEAQGQPLATHLEWLRAKGYDKAGIWLPHDGAQNEKTISTSFEKSFREAGYPVVVIPNQGAGAAMKRVEAARRQFPQIHFNEETCKGGLDALGWYHEKRDPSRDIGLGPDHDWSSHGADAFGLMCIVAETATEPTRVDVEKLMDYSTAFA